MTHFRSDLFFEVTHFQSDRFSQIQNYDSYIRRNLSRGYDRKDLNVGPIHATRLKTETAIKKTIDESKHLVEDTYNWTRGVKPFLINLRFKSLLDVIWLERKSSSTYQVIFESLLAVHTRNCLKNS